MYFRTMGCDIIVKDIELVWQKSSLTFRYKAHYCLKVIPSE